MEIDLLKINIKPVVHVVQIQKHLSETALLPHETMESFWITFLKCWTIFHTGFSEIIKPDKGLVFTKTIFGKIVSTAVIEIDCSGIECHKYL